MMFRPVSAIVLICFAASVALLASHSGRAAFAQPNEAPPFYNDDARDDRDVVLFAAEAVQLRPPVGWKVFEVPQGREMRLLVTSTAPNDRGILPSDGVWLTAHVDPLLNEQDAEDLRKMLAFRLFAFADDAINDGYYQHISIDGLPALKQRFITPSSDGDSISEQIDRKGFHVLVQTTWGVLEIHAVAPAELFDERAADFDRLLADLTIREAGTQEVLLNNETDDAGPIIGAWKAFRSRLYLTANGRIVIKPDATRLVAIDDESNPSSRARLTTVTGRFQARGDLLMVRWDDGSRLNFRWRLRGNELLLTDHEGQISQLRRILE